MMGPLQIVQYITRAETYSELLLSVIPSPTSSSSIFIESMYDDMLRAFQVSAVQPLFSDWYTWSCEEPGAKFLRQFEDPHEFLARVRYMRHSGQAQYFYQFSY